MTTNHETPDKWDKLKTRLNELLRISAAGSRDKTATRVINFIQEEMKELENEN